VYTAVERNLSSQNPPIGAELVAPNAIADDDGFIASRSVFRDR
jgi:hypothetical protein